MQTLLNCFCTIGCTESHHMSFKVSVCGDLDSVYDAKLEALGFLLVGCVNLVVPVFN